MHQTDWWRRLEWPAASDKMAYSQSFSKWKSDANLGGFAIWPQSIWQDSGFSIFFKVNVRRKPSEIMPHLTLNNNWAGGPDYTPSDEASSPWRVARQEIWQQNSPGICTATLLPDNKSWYRKMDLFWRKGISFCFTPIVCSDYQNQEGEKPSRNYCVKLKCSTNLVKLAKLERSKHRGICCQLGGAILQEVISTVIARDGKRWQEMVISTNIVSGGKTWQWEVLEIFFQCLANSLHSGSYDNSHHTSGTKWIWHFGFEIWNLSNVFDFLPYNHLVFWIRLDLLAGMVWGETSQELPILSLVNFFWIKGNVKILAQYLLQKKSLTSLTLTKSQFQMSINSSASIMIV